MKTLNIGILCNAENGSPKVLAETLSEFLKKHHVNTEIFYQIKALKRKLPAATVKKNPLLWWLFKLKHRTADKKLFKQLKRKDAVVVCSTTPLAFQKDSYNFSYLKEQLNGKPVLYYAVQYIENSPTIIERLQKAGHSTSLDRFHWHMSISPVTELRGTPKAPWSQIGMNLEATGLKPEPKKEFYAIVDFVREGFEKYREEQIQALKDLNIPYISLEQKYSMNDIREIYKQGSIFFIQFPEAYGMPIAECLATGCYIATPDSSWAMSWRLDEKLEVHGPGTLPKCFMVYNGLNDLKKQLSAMRDTYHTTDTPNQVFKVFTENYHSFYYGNADALTDVLDKIRNNQIPLT